MRIFLFLIVPMVFSSCTDPEKLNAFTAVSVETIFEDSLSIRAIEIMDGNTLAFAADKGVYGTVNFTSNAVRTNVEKYHTSIPEFRAIANNTRDFFMLSIGNPALLYKTGSEGKMDLVYMEEGEGVFYDAITFWNVHEGIAVGDTVDGCLSILITRDAGYTWNKLGCDVLPEMIEGEGAFAASDSNIKTVGDNTWIATTKRILFSPDKGASWQVQQVPIEIAKPTQGIYSIDFYNENLGIAFGGDYTEPTASKGNKAITTNGGATWQLVAESGPPGYKSCVQFVPQSKGEEIVALGFTGISYSSNKGEIWNQLSDEPFYTFRFLNDSVAYAAGKGRIAKLIFK